MLVLFKFVLIESAQSSFTFVIFMVLSRRAVKASARVWQAGAIWHRDFKKRDGHRGFNDFRCTQVGGWPYFKCSRPCLCGVDSPCAKRKAALIGGFSG